MSPYQHGGQAGKLLAAHVDAVVADQVEAAHALGGPPVV
jgi:hypothetical protein